MHRYVMRRLRMFPPSLSQLSPTNGHAAAAGLPNVRNISLGAIAGGGNTQIPL
jgi:hypothetical protein